MAFIFKRKLEYTLFLNLHLGLHDTWYMKPRPHFAWFRVAQAYVNQKKLDTETKILQANAAQFSKQTTQWLHLVEDFNQSLKVQMFLTTSIVKPWKPMCYLVSDLCFGWRERKY